MDRGALFRLREQAEARRREWARPTRATLPRHESCRWLCDSLDGLIGASDAQLPARFFRMAPRFRDYCVAACVRRGSEEFDQPLFQAMMDSFGALRDAVMSTARRHH